MKQKLLFIAIIIFMIILIIYPSICMEGAKAGMILWYQSIVPTLLPYMMLTNLLMDTGVLEKISSNKKFFSINTLLAIFIGFLCGYPMGAHYVSANYKSGNINKACAYWLISFVNLCSPAFIIQYIVIGNLNASFLLPMLISIYSSALLTALITLPVYYYNQKRFTSNTITVSKKQINSQPVINAMLQCLSLLGYIIIFSIILKMVTAFTNTVTIRHIILIGILEITNGIAFAAENVSSKEISAIMMAGFTAFGSISCIFQTKSVLKDSRLRIFPYIIAKIIQSILSVALIYIIFLFK